MSSLPVSALAVEPRHLVMLLELLTTTVPGLQVLAYGSRTTGTSHETSDLDLALISPDGAHVEAAARVRLMAALLESDLPFRVDVAAFHALPTSFQSTIESHHVVLQTNGPHGS